MVIRRAPSGSCIRAVTALLSLAGAVLALPAQGQAQTPLAHYPITRADVDFVTGMISHHAQALVMAELAPERAASRAVKVLCARIINAQTDEIVIFQQWLKDHGLPVPEAKPVPMKMMMGGVEHEMMMPGMLTDAQMRELERSTGVDFDRTFLTYMIQHHEGAVTMVNQVLASPGAAQDEFVFRSASDIYADQTAEIDRMQQLLSSLQPR
jgi:uncharacterized protein (DUF305 family)